MNWVVHLAEEGEVVMLPPLDFLKMNLINEAVTCAVRR